MCRAVGWGGCFGCAPPPPRWDRRPRSAYRLVKSRILSGSSPLFSPNSLKSPLNWLDCTQKILGASSQNPVRPPLSSHPGSATDTATPRERHCHSPITLNTSSPQGWYIVVRGSNAYFWSNLESGSKVFFSMFSCYIGIVLHETAWWHSYNIEHFYITRFIKSRQSGRKIMVLHGSKNTNIYIKRQTNLYLPSLEIVCLQC